jgi:hypothetical protein
MLWKRACGLPRCVFVPTLPHGDVGVRDVSQVGSRPPLLASPPKDPARSYASHRCAIPGHVPPDAVCASTATVVACGWEDLGFCGHLQELVVHCLGRKSPLPSGGGGIAPPLWSRAATGWRWDGIPRGSTSIVFQCRTDDAHPAGLKASPERANSATSRNSSHGRPHPGVRLQHDEPER